MYPQISKASAKQSSFYGTFNAVEMANLLSEFSRQVPVKPVVGSVIVYNVPTRTKITGGRISFNGGAGAADAGIVVTNVTKSKTMMSFPNPNGVADGSSVEGVLATTEADQYADAGDIVVITFTALNANGMAFVDWATVHDETGV